MLIAIKKTSNIFYLLMLLIFLVHVTHGARAAEREEGEVYVADQGFTLEQAISQALAENAGDAKRRFWIVVSGRDATKLASADADSGLRDSIKHVRAQGGIVYVCESDMRTQGIAPTKLMPEVTPVQGFGGAPTESGSPSMPQIDTPLPQDVRHTRLILKTCADNGVAQPPAGR
jgi:intracellular sulfur oxidation DsrE/DsrF family protein